jgi:hypothetical protein
MHVGRGVLEPKHACAEKAGSRDARVHGRVREERGGVAREPERGRVVFRNRGRREKKGGEGKRGGKRKGRERKGKRKGEEKKEEEKEGKIGKKKRKKRNGGKREREGSDARWRYSRWRPRLVGHVRATFARCARRKEKGGGVTTVGFGCQNGGETGRGLGFRVRQKRF